MLGTYALSSGYYDAYYGTRAEGPHEDRRATSPPAFERFDFVVTPTSPWTAFQLGAKTDDPLAMYLNDFCTVPMPLAGIPAISIPTGSSEGLPVGFQLAGPAFSENRMLDAAYALEQAIGFDGSEARVSRRCRASTSPSSASRSTSSSRRGRRCSAAASCRSATRRTSHTCPVCLGLPGALPVVNARAVHFALHDRAGARLRDRAAVALPPQELLLSRPPEGLPDLPVRRPDLRAAGASATSASTAPTSRRTRPSSTTSATSGRIHGSRAQRWSTSTAAARRWWRSSPSPTSAPPSRPASG